MSALIGTTADWYLMRASGFVALALLTVTVSLGVANLARLAGAGWTRSVAALVHRNLSLLAVVFVAFHVLTAVGDAYVRVPALSVVIPGASGYDPLWVGLGAVSVDLVLAVVVTSLLRARLGRRTWRLTHLLAYLSWPVALFHAVGSGSGTGADTGLAWSTGIYVGCALAFGGAVTARLVMGRRPAVTPRPDTARPLPRYSRPAAGRPVHPPLHPGVRPLPVAAVSSPRRAS